MGGALSGTAYIIPYEKQSNTESTRTCGAACLSMVYQSLGKEATQEEIWPAISKVNRFGSLASTTHLMVSDALKRGFDAVAIKARHPIFSLRCLRDTNARVIINHRLSPDVPTGHYSVLVNIGDRDVTLHDPYSGPSRRLSHAELMRLWEPGVNTEITGETLIAISTPETTPAVCEICNTPIPPAVACPQCAQPVGLRPSSGIGCISQTCVVRRWLFVCCPHCDYMWNFASGAAAVQAKAPEKPEEKPDPFQFGKLFKEIDKFCALIAAMPVAAANPKVMAQLEIFKGAKQKLTEGAEKQMDIFQAHHDKRMAIIEKGKQASEAKKKKMEERNAPPAPLDGNDLSLALMKNMGLIRRTGLTEIMKMPGKG